MDNISDGMRSLCEDIVTGHKGRKNDIKQLRESAETIRDNARKFLAESKKFHEEMGKGLTKSLQESREELIKNVDALREDFRKKEKETRTDLATASKIWNEMNETLKSKKTKCRPARRSFPAPSRRKTTRRAGK